METPFANRRDAGRQLAALLRTCPLIDPLVLALPPGGVEVGEAVARELGADLDVLIARRLRAPLPVEVAVGAVDEAGEIYLDPEARGIPGLTNAVLRSQLATQLRRIYRQARAYRGGSPPVSVAGRSVIVVDDGAVTGWTMTAALRLVAGRGARQVVAALPVSPAETVELLRRSCDDVVCVSSPCPFAAIARAYEDFSPVEEDRVARFLARHASRRRTWTSSGV